MRSCLIREHPCLRLPRHTLSSHYPPFYRSLPFPFFLSHLRPRSGSLYTRSLVALNVLSLLMPRSACPRGRSTNIFACCLLFRAPILSYTRGVFIVQNPPARESKREYTPREGTDTRGQASGDQGEVERERWKRVDLRVARIRAGKRRKKTDDRQKQQRLSACTYARSLYLCDPLAYTPFRVFGISEDVFLGMCACVGSINWISRAGFGEIQYSLTIVSV